jgi:hypothetical protein
MKPSEESLMAAKTAISLTDGEATPIVRVFNPAKKEGDVYRWDNRASGIVANYDQLNISTRLPTKTAKATKVTMRLVMPIMEQTSPSTSTGIQPAPTVAYVLGGEIVFNLPERSDQLDRRNLLTMMRDLIDEQLTTDVVENYDFPYF